MVPNTAFEVVVACASGTLGRMRISGMASMEMITRRMRNPSRRVE